jgi:hypothetical protein
LIRYGRRLVDWIEHGERCEAAAVAGCDPYRRSGGPRRDQLRQAHKIVGGGREDEGQPTRATPRNLVLRCKAIVLIQPNASSMRVDFDEAVVTNPAGKSSERVLRLDFDSRLMLQFRGSVVTSDAGLLAYRELDGLSAIGGETLSDTRAGKNGRHARVGMLRQAVFGRLAGYEDVNDAERLRHDPAMRWIVGGNAASERAASARRWAASRPSGSRRKKNLSALADLSGQWIDRVHDRRPPKRHRARHGFERQPDAW